MKFCTNCGKQLSDGEAFCSGCGKPVQSTAQSPVQANRMQTQTNPAKAESCVPAFVLGLIGAIFGLFGGMCVAACNSIGGNEGAALFLIVGGSIVGLIGACMCFKRAKLGSVVELIGAVMMAICIFGVTGADFMSIIGMIMLAIGGLIGLLLGSIK
ncbi:MAG: zinc-ribbon domain-containing protein [Ruminococcaceae bacterium]|nr:zinc-ribbon domain-containing protein [Oscillospiraceae bacterium]